MFQAIKIYNVTYDKQPKQFLDIIELHFITFKYLLATSSEKRYYGTLKLNTKDILYENSSDRPYVSAFKAGSWP